MHSLRSLIGNRYYKLVYKPSEKQIIKNEAKCIPGCMRYDFSTKLHKRKWFEEMAESEVVEINFFYNKYEVPVKEHVFAYDHWNLISDFGGYLGLLLGYSFLAFYDTMVFIIGKVMKKISPRGKITMTLSKPAAMKNP